MLFFPTKLFKKFKSFFSYLKLFAFKYFHIISSDYAEGNDQLFKDSLESVWWEHKKH
ncbi:unnamed protein product [Meloidogyne enterolobii]|uniref:Uncharacterized protein n=1 Tax=Meloidogyne enterolobii TaxID=390850 RepID=A0ACB1B0J2_MELEN